MTTARRGIGHVILKRVCAFWEVLLVSLSGRKSLRSCWSCYGAGRFDIPMFSDYRFVILTGGSIAILLSNIFNSTYVRLFHNADFKTPVRCGPIAVFM